MPKTRTILRPSPSRRAADLGSQTTNTKTESKSSLKSLSSVPLKLFENERIKTTVEEKPSDRWSMPVFIVTLWQKQIETENDRTVAEFETLGGAFAAFADHLIDELVLNPQVRIEHKHHEIVGGKHGGKQGTIVAKGWHDNYSDFKTEIDGKKIEGCITYVGDGAMLEVGKDHRFQINFQPVIRHCIEKAMQDE